jgi:hypothetical protein
MVVVAAMILPPEIVPNEVTPPLVTVNQPPPVPTKPVVASLVVEVITPLVALWMPEARLTRNTPAPAARVMAPKFNTSPWPAPGFKVMEDWPPTAKVVLATA